MSMFKGFLTNFSFGINFGDKDDDDADVRTTFSRLVPVSAKRRILYTHPLVFLSRSDSSMLV